LFGGEDCSGGYAGLNRPVDGSKGGTHDPQGWGWEALRSCGAMMEHAASEPRG